MSIQTTIVPFTARTTTGTQHIGDPYNITSQPIAMYIFLAGGQLDQIAQVHFNRCFGATDGVRQWASHAWWKYNILSPIRGRTLRNDQILQIFDPTTEAIQGAAVAVGGSATPVADGWIIDWTWVVPPINLTFDGYAVFFHGTDITAYADVHAASASVAIGFTPKIIFSNTSNTNINTIVNEFKTSQGVVSVSNPLIIGDHVGVACTIDADPLVGHGPLEGKAFYNDKIPSGGTNTDFTYTYDHFTTPNTLTIVSAGRTNEAVGFLALDWTSNQRTIAAGQEQDVSPPPVNVGFQPQIVGYLGAGGGISSNEYGVYQYPDVYSAGFVWHGITNSELSRTFGDSLDRLGGGHKYHSKIIDYWASLGFASIQSLSFNNNGWNFYNIQFISGGNIKWLYWAIEGNTQPIISTQVIEHYTNSLLKNYNIDGIASFSIGLNVNMVGTVNGDFTSITDPSCLNNRLLSKYGWEPTNTPTKTFSNCKPKR